MHRAPGPYVRVALGGLAATAVVAAHSFTHELAPNQLGSSLLLLEEASPRTWSLLVGLAFGTLVIGLAGLSLGQLRKATPVLGARTLYPRVAVRLVGLQVVAFIFLEALERWLGGSSIVGLSSEPVLLVGSMLQLLAAVMGAALLVLFAKTVQRLTKRGAHPKSSDARNGFISTPVSLPPRFAVATGGPTLRGPPLRS